VIRPACAFIYLITPEHDMQRFLDTSVVAGIILGIIPVLNSRYHNKTFSKEKIDPLFESIISKYGIKIVYEIGEDFFLL
jgi:diphthamide synthase (EF-2-diphthine--ammonia ligase)